MELRPYRLAVRTPGSHPGNPGSIPGGVTKSELERNRSPRRTAFVSKTDTPRAIHTIIP